MPPRDAQQGVAGTAPPTSVVEGVVSGDPVSRRGLIDDALLHEGMEDTLYISTRQSFPEEAYGPNNIEGAPPTFTDLSGLQET